MGRKLKDLTGQRFGIIDVLKLDHIDNRDGGAWWICKCSICGNERIVLGRTLQVSYINTKSCSCGGANVGRRNKENRKININEPINHLFLHYKNGARVRNLSFELTKEEFKVLTKQNCWYCNSKPDNIQLGRSGNPDYIYMGIDRMNSFIGYTFENTVPCCIKCNKAKSTTDQKDFISWIKTVYNNIKDKS